MRVKVVIPALDEEAALPRVIAALPPGCCDEVIVVDNGSRDATAAVAAQAGARVVQESERGYGAACLRGIAAAGDCDAIAFLDADFSDYPEELPLLLAPLERGDADLVIGSRMILPQSRAALLPQARFGNWLAAALLRAIYGVRVTDLGPFRVVTTRALAQLSMADRDYGWTVEMQARAFARGLRVVEVPVRYRPRVGVSKIAGTVSGTLKAGVKILYTIAREWLRGPRQVTAPAATPPASESDAR
jgi:glycosyltransferase involved in cell wall biosynthesis